MRKYIWKMLLALLMLPALVLSARALDTQGSIWLRLDVGELPVINGGFTLYQVGIPISDGYRIQEEFGGGFVRSQDARSPHLAQWLSDLELPEGKNALLDADGNAVFSDLQDGLYLLIQTERTDGFYPIQPMLLTVPGDGSREVGLYLEPLPMVAQSPPTGQDPTPYIGAVGLVLSLVGLVISTRGKRRW